MAGEPQRRAGPSDPRAGLPGGEPAPRRWWLRSPIAWALIVLAVLWGSRWIIEDRTIENVSYSDIKERIRDDDAKTVLLSSDWVQLELATASDEAVDRARSDATAPDSSDHDNDEGASADRRLLRANRPPADDSLFDLLDEAGVTYSYLSETSVWVWVWPILLLLLLFPIFGRMAMAARSSGPQGILGFGKSEVRIHMEPDTGISFDDVAGIDEAVEELEEIVSIFERPERYRRLGGRIPKGVLLVGPPGTGKTLLARAVAGVAGVPFFSLSGAEFMEMFVGVGAARVRDLFRRAAEKAPAIIFIDELDALAKSRNAGGVLGGHDEREQTLNQLLSEMDGFDPRAGLIVLAATNRPEVLDPALMRPGRFDRQVLVDRPDRRGRLAILRLHARTVALHDDVDLERVAGRTPGLAGADLANIINEAALLAAREDADVVRERHFDEAIERVIAGLQRKNRTMRAEEKRTVAVHEAGHAVVAASVEHADPVHKVSIIPRGVGALGYTLQLSTDDRYLLQQDELLDRMTVMLGGRAAEELVFEIASTGAGDDLQKATALARSMVVENGMSDAIGPVSLEGERQRLLGDDDSRALPWKRRSYSDRTAEVVDEEVRRLVEEARQRAHVILERRREALQTLADRLVDSEVVEGDELEELLLESAGGDISDGESHRPVTAH